MMQMEAVCLPVTFKGQVLELQRVGDMLSLPHHLGRVCWDDLIALGKGWLYQPALTFLGWISLKMFHLIGSRRSIPNNHVFVHTTVKYSFDDVPFLF